MDAKEIRNRSDEQLNDELLKLRREQFSLRMQLVAGQGVKPNEFGRVRRNIARIKTILRERSAEKSHGG
ncbi:MAG: 50S ribosomal protein L29 [Steroidobacteraceae bacterium]